MKLLYQFKDIRLCFLPFSPVLGSRILHPSGDSLEDSHALNGVIGNDVRENYI